MSEDSVPQVRMRDGAASQPQPSATEDLSPSPFPSEPQPGERYEIDAKGIKIGVKWWTAVERLMFFEILGPQSSSNPGVMDITVPAYLICDYNGKGFARPTSRAQLNARVATLGDAAIMPAGKVIARALSRDEDEAAAELKNG